MRTCSVSASDSIRCRPVRTGGEHLSNPPAQEFPDRIGDILGKLVEDKVVCILDPDETQPITIGQWIYPFREASGCGILAAGDDPDIDYDITQSRGFIHKAKNLGSNIGI